jgi:hypothetical protein
MKGMSDAPKLTRREALSGMAAAGAGALIGPAAARAATGGPGSRVFSRWVGELAGQSRVLSASRSFSLAGVQWSEPARTSIQLRARAAGGPWGPWALASVQGHDADRGPAAGGRADRGTGSSEEGAAGRFGEPLWCGRADEIQLRSSAPATGVRVHFVAPSADARPLAQTAAQPLAQTAALPLAGPNLPAGPGEPPIIARSAWARGGARPAAGPFYGSVKLAFVHHTDNPNGYSAGEVPAMLLAIYDYHRYVRGFYDIAYNFIIDAFGRIWEAREGGIDEPVIGAHAGGYNEVSTGIAVLGTFMSSVPPPAAIQSLERLLAWKLSLHGIPTTGRVTVEVDPSDAFYTPFRPGQHVSLPRVAGHRDGDLTDCPGNAFYGRLPSIRPRVAALAGTPARLTLSSAEQTVARGAPVTLHGRLTSLDGPAIAGAPLEIQTIGSAGAARTVANVVTDVDGNWSASLTVSRNALVRALHPVAPAAVSGVADIEVLPVLTLTLASASPPRVTGTVTPGKPRVTLDIYRVSGGRRHLLTSRRVTVRRGGFAATLSLRHGTYVVVARTAAAGGTLAGASAPLTVRV